MVAHANKPVFSEDMVVLMQAGKEVPWEPAIITELSGKHLFKQRKIIDRIHAHQFAYMILKQNYYAGRYSPAVEDAIEKDYPDEQLLAGMRVLSPDIPDAPDQPRHDRARRRGPAATHRQAASPVCQKIWIGMPPRGYQ